jgi:hypothetical protein
MQSGHSRHCWLNLTLLKRAPSAPDQGSLEGLHTAQQRAAVRQSKQEHERIVRIDDVQHQDDVKFWIPPVAISATAPLSQSAKGFFTISACHTSLPADRLSVDTRQ